MRKKVSNIFSICYKIHSNTLTNCVKFVLKLIFKSHLNFAVICKPNLIHLVQNNLEKLYTEEIPWKLSLGICNYINSLNRNRYKFYFV